MILNLTQWGSGGGGSIRLEHVTCDTPQMGVSIMYSDGNMVYKSAALGPSGMSLNEDVPYNTIVLVTGRNASLPVNVSGLTFLTTITTGSGSRATTDHYYRVTG